MPISQHKSQAAILNRNQVNRKIHICSQRIGSATPHRVKRPHRTVHRFTSIEFDREILGLSRGPGYIPRRTGLLAFQTQVCGKLRENAE